MSRNVTYPECFICYIGCINIAKECLLCFSSKSNAVVTLLVVVICFSISLLVFEKLFLRRDCFMIFLVIVLLMKRAWFALTYLFFKGACFVGVTWTVYFEFFKRAVFLTRAEMKKCISEIIDKSFI